jgi:hypothetical protein
LDFVGAFCLSVFSLATGVALCVELDFAPATVFAEALFGVGFAAVFAFVDAAGRCVDLVNLLIFLDNLFANFFKGPGDFDFFAIGSHQ